MTAPVLAYYVAGGNVKRRENKFLTERETDGLKASCETFTDQLIVFGILYTGMRVSELVNMRPSWIAEDYQSIRIPKREGDWHPKTIKGHIAARRVLVLNPALSEILKYFVEKNYTVNMTRKEVYDRLQYLWKKTGATDQISPHILRHTALSRLIHAGYTVDSVARQAGHVRATTTLDTYVHADNIEFERQIKERGGIK